MSEEVWKTVQATDNYEPTVDHLRHAVEGLADDYMTSETHHPGWVLIPEAKFEQICSALTLKDDPGNGGKPVICIGHHTINQLMAGQDVEIEAAIMVPASDLCQPTPADLRIAELEAALEQAKKRMRNCRGAIESNQVIDKDVHGSLTNGMADIDAAIRALIPREG